MIEPQVRQFCGPIFFSRSLQTASGNIIANGSFGLVDTGNKKLLVTNFHVWDGFHQERLDDPKLQMCISVGKEHPLAFAPDKALGEDRDLDIATFDMEPLLAACAERKVLSLEPVAHPITDKLRRETQFILLVFQDTCDRLLMEHWDGSALLTDYVFVV